MRVPIKVWQVLAGLLLALLPHVTANALPSNDPKFRTQVKGPDGTTLVLTRDPFDPYAWYYLPGGLRIAEGEPGQPKFRWSEFVLKGKQHAVLQLAVTGQLVGLLG